MISKDENTVLNHIMADMEDHSEHVNLSMAELEELLTDSGETGHDSHAGL